jgi:hypothetical protein
MVRIQSNQETAGEQALFSRVRFLAAGLLAFSAVCTPKFADAGQFRGTCAQEPTAPSYVRHLDAKRSLPEQFFRPRCVSAPTKICDECIAQRPDIERPWRYCVESPDFLAPVDDPYYGFYGTCDFVDEDFLNRWYNDGDYAFPIRR